MRCCTPELLSVLLMAGLIPGCQSNTAGAYEGRALPRTSDGVAPAPTPTQHRPAGERWIKVMWTPGSPLPRLPRGQVWAFDRGRRRALTVAEARRRGFTLIDLGDNWTPILFTEWTPGEPKPVPFPYRQTYLELSNDQRDRLGRRLRRGQHNHLELYGIPPTPSVIRKRLLDTKLRQCLASVDREALRAWRRSISAWGFRYVIKRARTLRPTVKRLLRKYRLKDVEALAARRKSRQLARRYQRADLRARAVQSALQVFRCEGFHRQRRRRQLKGDEVYAAITKYERKHMILGRGVLNRRLAQFMARSVDAADAAAFRRVLRERVVHAARILEDGSARRIQRHYVDRQGRKRTLPNLVRDFTRAAEKGLGLESTAAIRNFLISLPAADLRDLVVAVKLPPRPDYYSKNMNLEAVISRGDVWYDPPLNAAGKRISQPRSRLPYLTLWLQLPNQRIPLVRWRTTVGGWNDEIKDGLVYLKYKPSKVGRRVWRDIVAAPIWIPPPTTPPREIVRGKKIDRRRMGPGHLSAYGLVAAPHLLRVERKGVTKWHDQGIRSHGSFNYRSIRSSFSHGCHRLYNHKAIRLFSFLLRHRPYQRVGLEPYPYQHRFEYKGRKYRIKVDNRGYVFRFAEPVPITVTRGRVLGKARRPIDRYIRKPGVAYPPDGGVDDTATGDGGVGPVNGASPDAGGQ